jgi:hypothetical protein
MKTTTTAKSPDQEVTGRICAVLGKAHLLPAESIAKLQALLLAGTMTAEEWKFLFEPAEPQDAQGG